MLKNVLVGIVSDFMEIVHIELPHKWWEIAMAEEEGEHLLLELVNFTDDESGAVWIPANDILVLLILNRNTQTSSISTINEPKS